MFSSERVARNARKTPTTNTSAMDHLLMRLMNWWSFLRLPSFLINNTARRLNALKTGTSTLNKRIRKATRVLLELNKVSMVPRMLWMLSWRTMVPTMGKLAPTLMDRMGSVRPGYRQQSEMMIRMRAMMFLVFIMLVLRRKFTIKIGYENVASYLCRIMQTICLNKTLAR